MRAFLETLFDIIRLRRGPDAIPCSRFLCLIALALWLLSGFVFTVMIEGMDGRDYLVGTFTGVVGLAAYAAAVVLTGRAPRLLQTLTAVLGCAAMLRFAYVAGSVFLAPFTGVRFAGLLATLILLWSIPVQGHIVARALDRHWYVGIVFAMAVFVSQLYLYWLLNPPAETAA
ncbi:MAG: hypothetical protein MJA32_03580 [Proteobacteria bacterium]|nr:hypothetical protein [Pseudomonadota bacterium]